MGLPLRRKALDRNGKAIGSAFQFLLDRLEQLVQFDQYAEPVWFAPKDCCDFIPVTLRGIEPAKRGIDLSGNTAARLFLADGKSPAFARCYALPKAVDRQTFEASFVAPLPEPVAKAGCACADLWKARLHCP